MNYEIEVRQDQDLFIARHYRYNSADDVKAYLEEFAEHFSNYPYRRLLADYSRLEEVNLSFVDKIKVLSKYSHIMVKVARRVKLAAVTTNDFQKAIARQARSLSSAQEGDDITGTTHYFDNEQDALAWLLADD